MKTYIFKYWHYKDKEPVKEFLCEIEATLLTEADVIFDTKGYKHNNKPLTHKSNTVVVTLE